MIAPGDRIAVCISGGKDSMLLAKCMQHLHRVSDFPFEVEFIVMDPGYLPQNRELIEYNCREMNISFFAFLYGFFIPDKSVFAAAFFINLSSEISSFSL